jgi:phi13 family phage major tail protein
MAVKEAPKTASTIGLKNVVIAEVLTDNDTETTYGEIQKMAGAIDATLTPENTEPEVQDADDGEFDAVYPAPSGSFTTSMADIPLEIRAMIFGERLDDNGVLISGTKDVTKYFAIGFMSEKADHTYRYVWLYKVRARPMTENYATRGSSSVTRQQAQVQWDYTVRKSDGEWRGIGDVGQNNFTEDKAKTFFDTVYSPKFSA